MFVSRAGVKLAHALDHFALDVRGLVCADFGCNVGGFTHCLLERGATRVFAVDTAYGTLAYELRRDTRVVVMERTNALHAPPPEGPVDLVAVDLGWTTQRHAVPAAVRWLGPGRSIVTLVKPHYELTEAEKRTRLTGGAVDPDVAENVLRRILDRMPAWGAEPLAHTPSPITGAKSARHGKGNVEFLVLARVLAAGSNRS